MNMVNHGGKALSYRLPSFGTFSTSLKPSYFFGIPQRVEMAGIRVNIDFLNKTLWATDNNRETTIALTRQVGMMASSLEHRVPELLFTNEEHPGEAVSAMKALMVAAREGQRIYTVTHENVDSVLPLLNVRTDVKDDIRNAVAVGKVAIVSQNQITVGTWTGVGYIITDPQTGTGAYLITGGQNGGEMGGGFGDLLAFVGLGLFNLVIPPVLADEDRCGEDEETGGGEIKVPSQEYLKMLFIIALFAIITIGSRGLGSGPIAAAILMSFLVIAKAQAGKKGPRTVPQCEDVHKSDYVCTGQDSAIKAIKKIIDLTLAAAKLPANLEQITYFDEEIKDAYGAISICKLPPPNKPKHQVLWRGSTGDHPGSIVSCTCCGKEGYNEQRWAITMKPLRPTILYPKGEFDDYGQSRRVTKEEIWATRECLSTQSQP